MTEFVPNPIHFPKGGIDKALAFGKQPQRPLADGRYARTAYFGKNVRAYDPATGRLRGGSRVGLAKAVAGAVVANWLIQDLGLVVGTGYSAPGGGVSQSSLSGRLVTLVAVSQGNVYVANAGDSAWTTPTNNTGASPPLNITGIVRSSAVNQKLYFADGTNYRYYTPATNSVENWTASAGQLPRDSANNAPRLITTYRGSIVLSGLIDDPQNWFMSSTLDPTDFDYGAANSEGIIPTGAVAGNNGPLGFIGDVVNTMIPWSDDLLIFGCDHSIWMLRGHPLQGGSIDMVTDKIGMAFGQPWDKSPDGTVYFFSNRPAVYAMTPGGQPQRLSQSIEQHLNDIDTGTNGIRLLWDERFQALHVFVSPLSAPATTTHFAWEKRTGAWWTDQFGDTDFDPLTCCVLDGNRPDDRIALIGSWDGYVRNFDEDATDDDGTSISSEVWLGPFLTPNTDRLILHELQGILGETSGDVTYAVHVGRTAEEAVSSTAGRTGTLSAGRNRTHGVRREGHAIYIRLTSTSRWAMETIRAVISTRGKVGRRVK